MEQWGATGSDETGSDVTGSGLDRKWCQSRDRKGRELRWRHNRKYVLRMRNRYILYYYYISSTKCSTVLQVPWLPDVMEVTWPRRCFPWAHACTTGSCAISVLVGLFDRKWHHETSPVITEGHVTPKVLPLEITRSEVPLGCSLGHPHPISSMATGTSPFTGYLPLSRHFISAFKNGFHIRCFRIGSLYAPNSLSRPPLWGY